MRYAVSETEIDNAHAKMYHAFLKIKSATWYRSLKHFIYTKGNYKTESWVLNDGNKPNKPGLTIIELTRI